MYAVKGILTRGDDMALNDAELAILKTEIETDPLGLGYDNSDPNCAEILNAVNPAWTLPNTSVEGWKVRNVVNMAEFN